MSDPFGGDPRTAFMEASILAGPLERARAILAAHPDIVDGDIHTAAILGNADAVRRFLQSDARNAVAKGGPRGWDPLTHLCFSRWLRLDPARSDGFVRAAAALLDAGASANTGFFEMQHTPKPAHESVLYGAAGVAHHAALTRLLVERGADVNDGEVAYHTPETYDNGVLRVLVESGRLTADSLATMLLRKADWHDGEGVRYLLESGADPNRMTVWGFTALHQALRRDNGLPIVEAMLDYGADPSLVSAKEGRSGAAIAARAGRGDALDAFERRGLPIELEGVDRLIAACARNDAEAVGRIAREPGHVSRLIEESGAVLAAFAGAGNTEGIRRLLSLGVDVRTTFRDGDGYWDIARDSSALHVAAWRARHETVRLLVGSGARVDAEDGKGRTPLQLAVRACVDSYWTRRRAPDSVKTLLDAGAAVDRVAYPTGYDEVDALLAARGAR
jgi:ankyrin repeat protein